MAEGLREKLFIEHRPYLIENVEPSPRLWAQLTAHKIVLRENKEYCMVCIIKCVIMLLLCIFVYPRIVHL